jgi:hypothetical protein
MVIRIGIDIAVRAPHQASVANEAGVFAFSGHRFRTSPDDLERLWDRLPDDTNPSDVEVIMEPCRCRICHPGRGCRVDVGCGGV